MYNMKNKVGFIKRCDNYNKKIEEVYAFVGVNTALYPLVSMLIKMNKKNVEIKTKDK